MSGKDGVKEKRTDGREASPAGREEGRRRRKRRRMRRVGKEK